MRRHELLEKKNASEIKVGDKVVTPSGNKGVVLSFEGPKYAGDAGRVVVRLLDGIELKLPRESVSRTNSSEKKNGRAGVFKVGDQVTDIDGRKCLIVGEAASGEYYVVKYADGSQARMRELDLEEI